MTRNFDLKDIMKQLDVGPAEICRRLGVRPETLHRWVSGRAKMPGHLKNMLLDMVDAHRKATENIA